MRLIFDNDPETGEYYAVAENVVYNDQLVDSLWFADIIPVDNGYIMFWQEKISNKIPFDTLELAKEYILKEYSMHVPAIVGNRYPI